MSEILSNGGGSYSAPRLNAEKKDDDYDKRWAQFIIHSSVNDSWVDNHRLAAECYKFVEEGSDGELTAHLQKDVDNTDLPAIWLSLNTIPTKIDLLVGELETRGYDIRVRALNKEAISRKLEEKERLRVKRRLQPLMDMVDKQTGLGTAEPEYIPQTEQELNEYIDLSFKDKAEIIMEAALKWVAKKTGWDEERKALFRDVLIANKAFVCDEIIRGIPQSRRVHPNSMIWDTSCKKDSLEDANFFGELNYMPIAQAAEIYELTEDEIEEVYSSYQQYMGGAAGKDTISTTSDFGYDFGTISGNRLKWFDSVDGDIRVLVAKTCWRDYKVLNHKDEVKEKDGSEHFQEIKGKPRKRDKDKIVSKNLQVWRQCTIIGGHIIRETGEIPNQARSLEDIASTEPPYKAWIPNFSTGRGVSKVEQLAKIQLMKDIAHYNMESAMTRAGAKGMIYDLAMVPEGWSPEKAMRYMRTFGVMFINSKESQLMPGHISAFKEFDMTLSNSIEQYLKIMEFYENEMNKMSGVNTERQGQVQGASQGLGVMQSALMQSNLITQPYFIGFERFCSRVLNHQAKMIKISWGAGNKEQFAPIIGDSGVDFLREHIDLDLDEFGAWVESIPPIFTDRNKLEGLITMVLQANPEFIDDALPILMEPDTRVAVRKFQRKRALRKILEQQMQEEAAKQQQAIQQRVEALEMQKQDKELAANLQEQDMKNKGALERSMAQGRVKLSDTQIKAIADLTKSQLPTGK